jgi:hypothetical protein
MSLIEALKDIDYYDTIFFSPTEDEGMVKVDVGHYKDPGEKLDPGLAGDTFSIILFRLTEDFDLVDLDRFDAVLTDARYYVTRMIKEDWYGLVARKTTTSHKLTDETFDKWLEISYNNE